MEPTYRVVVHRDAEKGVFVARAPELPGCLTEGASRSEALARLEEEMHAQVHNMREAGSEPPPPIDEGSYSGELTIKVTSALHKDLVWHARDEGVPVEQLLTEIIMHALGGRGRGPSRHGDSERAQRADRPGQGSRYHGIMEDRANFIEYVRGLESGMRGGGGRGRNRGRR